LTEGLRGPICQPLSGHVCPANGKMSNNWGGLVSGCNHRPVMVYCPMTGSRPGWQATFCSYPKVAISKHFTVNQAETLIEAQSLI